MLGTGGAPRAIDRRPRGPLQDLNALDARRVDIDRAPAGDDPVYDDERVLGSAIDIQDTRVPAPLTGSALANPFKIPRDGNREQVIQKYRLWLWKHIRGRHEAVMRELAAIGPNTALACWRAPRHCHGHVVARAAAWLRRQGAARCAEDKAAPADSALRRKPPLPTRSQPTRYLGDTPHTCPFHPGAPLRMYRLPHIGTVQAHRLANGRRGATRQKRHEPHKDSHSLS